MLYDRATQCVAFVGDAMLAFGRLDDVAEAAKRAFDANTSISPFVFDAKNSVRIDLNLAGTLPDVLARLPPAAAEPIRGPGRPKLGVIPREVTLLPRHWEWLSSQPGGASVALRKLVELARKSSTEADERRTGTEACYRFMAAICGDYIGYEEATRALFAGDAIRFTTFTFDWPVDVKTHLIRLANAAFETERLDV